MVQNDNDGGEDAPANNPPPVEQGQEEENPPQNTNQPAEAAAQPEEDAETLRRRLEAAEHAVKSERGRQAALQKKLLEYQRAEAQKPAAPAISEEEAREIAELKENYPELAAFLEKRLGSVEKTVSQRLQATVEPLQAALNEQIEAREQAVIQEGLSAVSSKHSDWQQLIQSNEFGAWVHTQPPGFKQMLNSFDPSDINWVFDRYKEARNQAAQSIQAKKQTKLADAAGIPAKNLPVDTKQDSDDIKTLWAQMVAADEKESRARRR